MAAIKHPLPYCIMAGMFRRHERFLPDTHLTGRIIFRADTPEGAPISTRTYRVTSDNPGFMPGPASNRAIYGIREADGAEIRLDEKMQMEYGGENGWMVEKCYLDTMYNNAP